MDYEKNHAIRLLALSLVLALFFSVPVFASQASDPEESQDWDYYSGVVSVNAISNVLYLNFTGATTHPDDNRRIAHYEGHTPTSITFTQQKGYTYNGYFEKWVNFNVPSYSPLISASATPSIWVSDVVLPDGITLSCSYQAINSTSIMFKYRLQFSEYQATYTGDYTVYATTNMQQTCLLAAGSQDETGLYLLRSASGIEDWTGDLREYPFYSKDSGSTGSIIAGQQEGNALQEEANTIAQEGNALQQEGNALQQEANDLQREQNETVSSFFGSFFSKLGEALLSLVVPTSEQLSEFLAEVNDWFSARLGFIWYPFSFAVDMVTALAGGTANETFQIPALTIKLWGQDFAIWQAQAVNLDAFSIFSYVRFFTSALVVSGVVKLAWDKWNDWIGGRASAS